MTAPATSWLVLVRRPLGVFLLVAAVLFPHLASASIPQGSSAYCYHDHVSNKTLRVYTHWPEGVSKDAEIVFVFHGVNRDADAYRDTWAEHADRLGFIVIAPEFGPANFPGNAYSQGNIVTNGSINPQSEWSINIVDRLFDNVKAHLDSNRTNYNMFGHSAGAQFVHRALMFAPDLRVRRAVAANAGWYTVPRTDWDFPHGLKVGSNTLTALRYNQRHLILLGSDDNDPAAPNLARDATTDLQGTNRFDRGKFYYVAAAAYAGSAFNWDIAYAAGVGHSRTHTAPAASNWLIRTRPNQPAPLLYANPDRLYNQTFDYGLPTPANDTAPWVNNGTFPGIYVRLQNNIADGNPDDLRIPATYRIWNSSGNGRIHHYRNSASATDGLLGGRPGLVDPNNPNSNTGRIRYAMRLVNFTDEDLTRFRLQYDGRQFYRSGTGQQESIIVAYQIAEDPNLNGSNGWTTINLPFDSPNNSGSASGLNPFSSGNFVELSQITINNINWPNRASLWIRWTHNAADPGVNAHGLGLDNIRFRADAP